ncbi:hypothetical protein GH714_031185 [Hevea brasiliensis]|uniref:DUF1664 domain-containing protein n=1 Tax=Hevea brasiliensis TaxID=3981 RepID=A0A6A6K7Y1_HEVBR|nr:hypothetical protein GH714_031185 [Hevea brasiliensis]
MAMQAGVSTSKVLILAGAGLTSSIILRNGRLSELIAQLQELLKGVDEVEIASYKYDSALLAAQIRQLAQEIKELTLSNPVTILMGMLLLVGLSFSDVMFVTKQNMASAVASVSKQLENVSETLASTKRHLTKRLENLDWKVVEQIETSKLIANDVDEMKTNLSQIGYDVEIIHQMISGLEGKLELLENKQDATNSGLWYLCQFAGGFKDGPGAKIQQELGFKLANYSTVTYEDMSTKGLRFIAEAKELDTSDKSMEHMKKMILISYLTPFGVCIHLHAMRMVLKIVLIQHSEMSSRFRFAVGDVFLGC